MTQQVCARCRRCGVVLQAVGERLTDDALRALRDHIRAVHPDAELAADADAGAVLRHYDVVRAGTS